MIIRQWIMTLTAVFAVAAHAEFSTKELINAERLLSSDHGFILVFDNSEGSTESGTLDFLYVPTAFKSDVSFNCAECVLHASDWRIKSDGQVALNPNTEQARELLESMQSDWGISNFDWFFSPGIPEDKTLTMIHSDGNLDMQRKGDGFWLNGQAAELLVGTRDGRLAHESWKTQDGLYQIMGYFNKANYPKLYVIIDPENQLRIYTSQLK